MYSVHVYAGIRLSTGTKGTVQTYPYLEDDPSGPSRTRKESRQHAQAAMMTSTPVRLSHKLMDIGIDELLLLLGVWSEGALVVRHSSRI